MKQFEVKFKTIFLPFLLISTGTICTYTLFNWIVFIKIRSVLIDDGVVNIFAPMVLPGIPILIWLRLRIKLLNLVTVNSRSNPLAGYIMLAWVLVGIPNIIAQNYLFTATGKLTALNNIREIKDAPKTMYYTARQFYVNKNLVHPKTVFNVSGKGNVDFTMTIFSPVPVFAHLFPDTNKIALMRNRADPRTLILINDTIGTMAQLKKLPADSIRMMRYIGPLLVPVQYGAAGRYGALVVMTRGYKVTWKLPVNKIYPSAWLAIKYSQTISNRLSAAEKQQFYKDFLHASFNNFIRLDLTRFAYLRRVPDKWDLNNYNAAISARGDVEGDDQTILIPITTPFEKRNGDKLEWLIACFFGGAFIFLLALLLKPLRYKLH